jgi:hypothetical protein
MLKNLGIVVTAFLFYGANSVQAGVDFYSNTLFKTSFNSLQSWNPLDSSVGSTSQVDGAAAAVSVSTENDGTGTTLRWEDASSNYKVYFSNDSGTGRLKVLEATSGTSTSTWTYNSPGSYDLNSTLDTAVNPVDSAEQELFNNFNVAIGYSDSLKNYIGWSVEQSNGALYAIGWARINYNPATPFPNNTDEFQIVEWGYNYSTTGSSVTLGDSVTGGGTGGGGGGTVPEPQSLALMSLVGLGMLVRRRRTKS